jgi:hypothetical protein
MREQLNELSEDNIAEAVRTFDKLYAEMERVLWRLSNLSRAALLEHDDGAPALGELVWHLKVWWGVQGARLETKSAMAKALVDLEEWSPELFQPADPPLADAEEYAVDLVKKLVEKSQEMGAARREYSLASKVLHWLLPWRIPVYDSFVRLRLGVPENSDYPEKSYARVSEGVFRTARSLNAANLEWMGSLEPRSPLRALDKYFWRAGGGDSETAYVDPNPWRRVDELGLGRSSGTDEGLSPV